MKAITLNARQPLAHILLQFLQVPSHLLLEEQLLEPGSPSHQVRKILLYCIRVRRYYWKRHSLRHLLGPLDVEKFSEKLLPNLDIPPPLEASFCLPAIPNLWKNAPQSGRHESKPPWQCPCRRRRGGGRQWQQHQSNPDAPCKSSSWQKVQKLHGNKQKNYRKPGK